MDYALNPNTPDCGPSTARLVYALVNVILWARNFVLCLSFVLQ